jgi:O-antigen/teichoic acid export membrane protein
VSATTASAGHDARGSLSHRVSVDSLWILAGYAVTSLAGFAFWVVAARAVPPAQLGVDTAMISAITAAAGIASSGIGNAVLVFLPRSTDEKTLLTLVARTTAIVATVTGIVGGIIVATTIRSDAPWPLTVLAIAVATVAWAFFVVKDPVLTALGSARSTLLVNGPVNLVKLALVPVLTAAIGVAAHPVLASTLVPALGALALVYGVVLPRLTRPAGDAARVRAPMDRSERSAFFAFLWRDGTANGLYLGFTQVLPLLVTAISGPEHGAVFALCFQISLVLDLVVIGVGASLSTHSAVAHDAHLAFRMWLRVLALVIAGALVLIVATPLLLAILGGYYERSAAREVIAVLAAASVLRTSYEIWSASLRARRRTGTVLACSVAYVSVLVPAALIGTSLAGPTGTAIALFAATACLSIVGVAGLARDRSREVTS